MSTPVITFGELARVLSSEHIADMVSGGPTNEPMLKFVAQMLPYTRDVDKLTAIFYACVGPDYSGDTPGQIESMVERGINKGFDKEELDGKSGKKKASQAAVALAILQQMEPTLFHDEFNRTYISVSEPDKGPCIYTLKSQEAELFLKGLYYRAAERPLHRSDFEELLDILSAKAMFEGSELRVRHRISGDDDRIFVNLCNKDRQAVRIDKSGFNVVTERPVILMNLDGMSALPVPLSAGGVEESDPLFKLRDLLGLDEVNFLRVLAFMIGTLNPEGPYFFLLTEGEQGSGKSFLCRIIKDLIDPSAASKFVFPSSDRDLMIMASHMHLLLFDNVSHISSGMSDVLCSLSTGGGFATRKLYTDRGLQFFMLSRPYIINGITGVVTRPDLVERAIILKLKTMPDGMRKTEAEMYAEFEQIRPHVLARLYEIVSCALRNISNVSTPSSIRMADAARWIIAGEPATGLPVGTFLKALEDSQREAVSERMAENPIAVALYGLVEDHPYFGRVGDLYAILKLEDHLRFDKSFPKTSMHFSRELDRLRPALEKAGIIIEFGKKERDGRHLTIRLPEHDKEVVERAYAAYEYMRGKLKSS